MEMGNGFAFVAKQKHFQVGDSDFYADLILYSIKPVSYTHLDVYKRQVIRCPRKALYQERFFSAPELSNFIAFGYLA